MPSAFDVSHYLLTLQDDDAGDLISNLKLQKLLYYAQGLYLAMNEEALFPEKIYAWKHGPVVPDMYHFFKTYGANPIPKPNNFNFSVLNENQTEFLNEVYQVFGQFSAWKLRNMTHEEPPYKMAEASAGEITLGSMADYFKTYLTK